MTKDASMEVCKYESMQVWKYASMQVCTYAHICKYSSMQVCTYMHVCKYMQVCKYESMQVCLNFALCKVRGKLIVCSLCDIFFIRFDLLSASASKSTITHHSSSIFLNSAFLKPPQFHKPPLSLNIEFHTTATYWQGSKIIYFWPFQK